MSDAGSRGLKNLLGFIGLCQRAGKLAPGDGKTTDAVRRNRARLVLMSDDASENTAKKYRNMCESRGIPIITVCGRGELGAAIGREYAVTAAVTDKGFAARISELAERVDVNNGKNTSL